MADLKRAAEHRARADALGLVIQNLPPEEQAIALKQQNGLRQLADVEEWVALPPKTRTGAKHDLGLSPNFGPNAALTKLLTTPRKPAGRRPQPRPILAEVQSDAAMAALPAPVCPDCGFVMTPMAREKTNERLPYVRLFECRPCGIIKAPGASTPE